MMKRPQPHITPLLGLALLVVLGIAACSGSSTDGPPPEPTPTPEPNPEPEVEPLPPLRLPTSESDLSPSLARVSGEPFDSTRFGDVESCGSCHQDIVRQWSSSAHASASFNNPFYRLSIDAVREDEGHEASRHCGGCHDPLLLLSGKLEREIEPNDPDAAAGVTCLVCHSITEARPDGNGSYTLRTDAVPIPRRGDAASLAAHRSRLRSDALATAEMCGTCHQSFLGEGTGNGVHLPGIQTLRMHRASTHAGSFATFAQPEGHSAEQAEVENKRCQSCHMTPERAPRGDAAAKRGHVPSHRFAGAHTQLAMMNASPELLERAQANLRGAASLDIARATTRRGESLPADGASVRAGETLTLDLVIKNERAGHRFPGGTRDIQDTWVEIELVDSRGQRVGSAGDQHEQGYDETAHLLRALAVDETGHPETLHRVHRFRAPVYDHTIAPGDARVVQFQVTLPADLDAERLPLEVRAKLRHRRHADDMRQAACHAYRSERGQAFADASEARGRPRLDPCGDAPITEIAETRVYLGSGAPDTLGAPTWKRLYHLGIAWSHGLQERLDVARGSVQAGLEVAPDDAAKGRLRLLLGKVLAKQGRLDDALAAFRLAERLIGAQPAIEMARGQAYAKVWKWEEAAQHFERAAAGAPNDHRVWQALAKAHGSAGNLEGSRRAAARGLALSPRDEGLLRSQALALPQGEERERAQQEHLAHRSPDNAPQLRSACDSVDRTCRRDRQPIPLIEMRSTSNEDEASERETTPTEGAVSGSN